MAQAVSVILGLAASFGLNLDATQKAAILSVTVAFVPALLEVGWLHFRGLARQVLPAPTHVIVASPSAVASDTSATVSAKVGTEESVTVTHTAAGTTTSSAS